MKSFSQLLADYKTLSNDSGSSNDALGRILLNWGVKKTLGLKDFSFNKEKKTYASGTATLAYELPYNLDKVDYVHYWYSNHWYSLKEIKLAEQWRNINASRVTANIPYYYYYDEHDKQLEFYPLINTSKGTIEVGFTKKKRSLGDFRADYSTGSVSGEAGGTIFTLNATGSWGTAMLGRHLQVGGTNTPLDGFWFEITGSTGTGKLNSAEQIPYAFSSGTYLIAEMIPMPDGFEELPLYYALDKYYQTKEKPVLGREWRAMYEEGTRDLIKRDEKSTSRIIKRNFARTYDPNDNPFDMEITQGF